jgi:hypothetical protein
MRLGFTRRSDAVRVSRRLRDYAILSKVIGREIVIDVPPSTTPARVHDLVLRIRYEAR